MVHQSVVLRLVRGHEEVAVGILCDLVDRLARVLCENLVERVLLVLDLGRLDLDVGDRALGAAPWLVGPCDGVFPLVPVCPSRLYSDFQI